jgi:hypothetical protein
LSNTDGDGDGLDDNIDATDTNNVSNFDATNGITNPATELQENPLDNDVNSGGDVDFRDNVTGIDTDGDGIPDTVDIDDDDDGILDVNDGITNPSTSGLIDVDGDVNTGGDVDYRDTLVGTDTDGDGIVDSVDIDDDNDGILDTVEGNGDFDGDGIINSLDLDSDGDGILDIIESQPSTGANTLSGNDADNDGLDDNFDATPNGGAAGSNGTTPTVTTASDPS